MKSINNSPKNLHGNEYHCTLARHLPSLRLQGMWAQIERLVNMAAFEKKNADKAQDKWEYPILFAASSTLADATNSSINTAKECIKEFVRLGLLTPRFEINKEPQHRPSGRWQTHDYDVALHDSYAQFQACAPFRFCRRGGSQVVKSELRKTNDDRSGRFLQSSDALALMPQIVQMRDAGKSYQEIGVALGINKGQAQKLYKRATKSTNTVSIQAVSGYGG